MIIFGPWIGEFSYEISWWVPKVRKLAQERFFNEQIICIGYEGREILYSDFAHQYVAYDPTTLSNMGRADSGGVDNSDNQFVIQDPAAELFVKNWIGSQSYQQITPDNIQQHCGERVIRAKDTHKPHPFGNYKHLSASKETRNEIKGLLNNLEPGTTIAVLPRFRSRWSKDLNKFCVDGETLKFQSWEHILARIVEELKTNVVIINIPIHNFSGSFDFNESQVLQKHPHKILNVTFTGKGSVERQIALLQETECSFYSSTGAAVLTFFANTPMFCYTTTDQLPRYKHPWMLELTNGHEKKSFFAKYPTQFSKDYSQDSYYNTNPDEIFEEFSKFYKEKIYGKAS